LIFVKVWRFALSIVSILPWLCMIRILERMVSANFRDFRIWCWPQIFCSLYVNHRWSVCTVACTSAGSVGHKWRRAPSPITSRWARVCERKETNMRV
jgi:hypothetical protein